MTRHTSFWDRRRAAVKAEEAAAQQAAAEQAEAQHQATLAEKSDAELLAEFDLPDPDTLKAGDDFSAFMARAIPEHLRCANCGCPIRRWPVWMIWSTTLTTIPKPLP